MAELKKNLLRECPFCGSKKIMMWKNNWVQCESCWGSTGTYETAEEAIDAWNNRVTETEIRAKVIDEFAKALLVNEVVDKSVVRRVAAQLKERE